MTNDQGEEKNMGSDTPSPSCPQMGTAGPEPSAAWRMVPVEPTEEMIDAHFRAHAEAETVFADVPAIWSAMLAHAPAPPALGREEIARLIDPEVWEEIDGHRVAVDSFSGPSALPALSAHFVNEHKGEVERLGWPSLAKADAILAAQPVPAGDGGGWREMESAPREPRAPGHTRGPLVYLLIPYHPKPQWDVGYWEIGCEGWPSSWRHTGDDGPSDIAPIAWAPLSPPSPPDAGSGGIAATEPQEPYENNTLQGSGGKGEGV